MPATFHLSFAVPDLDACKRFYRDVLGCELGRDKDGWVNVHFFGHQVTMHQETARHPAVAIDHFGAVLPRAEWQAMVEACRAHDVVFAMEPTLRGEGTEAESGKFVILDPAGNRLEFKYKSGTKA